MIPPNTPPPCDCQLCSNTRLIDHQSAALEKLSEDRRDLFRVLSMMSLAYDVNQTAATGSALYECRVTLARFSFLKQVEAK